VDLMPTVLSLAGTQPPAYLQGKAFLGPAATEDPKYIYGFRDRMDERYDMSRAIRDQRYLYIRNFYPQRPQGTYLSYMFQTPTTQVWNQLFGEGKLNAAQSFFWEPKPSEELYDIQQDPYQIDNLAGSAESAETLKSMREALRDWMIRVDDVGLLPEGEMLERAAGDAPYTLGHDPQRFPVKDLYEIADLATRPSQDDLAALLAHQVDTDSGIRFWVANGLLIRAMRDQQRPAAVKAARGMTTDPSPYVRCIANETVARFGNASDRQVAMQALLQLADPRQSNTFVAMTAMNSLDWCSPTKAEVGEKLLGIPAKDAGLSSRYGSYIPNLIKRIESILE
jgi:hypothetical protein